MNLAERFRLAAHAFWKDHAYVIGLYSIAIGYPYVDIFEHNSFFFRAHNASLITVIITIFILFLFIPLLLSSIIGRTRKLFPKAARMIDFIYVAIMSFMASIYCNNSTLVCKYIPFKWQETAYWQLCIITAAIMIMLFCWRKTRDIFRCAAALPIVFIILSFFVLPSTELFRRPVLSKPVALSPIKNPVPVVIVIMDGFSLQALLDRNGEIDRQRFTHLAALADTSYWFKNARTVAGLTFHVLPAMMTGIATQLNPEDASISNYPRNIYTWLQPLYKSFSIREWRPYITLAPASINTHIFLMHRYIKDLFSMPYYFFLFPFEKNNLAVKDSREWVTSMVESPLALDEWLERIKPESSLNSFHLQKPHIPLIFNYNGICYENSVIPFGNDNIFPRYTTSLINLSFHQYLLQCGYADMIIGKIIAKLKKKKIFNNALIIVTADHGTTYYPGVLRRGGVSDIGLATTGFVPLFIKLPGQTGGVVSERQATSIDILPTICGVLQTDPPWPMDGNDLVGETFPAFDYDLKSKRIFYNLFVHKEETNYRSYSLDSVQKTLQKILQWKNLIIADNLPMNNTAANYTADEQYNPLLLHDSRNFTINHLKDTAIRANISNGIFLTAEVAAIPSSLSGQPLAITVHGKIFIITKPELWREHPLFLGGMFPAADASPASIEYFVIGKDQDHVVLHKISKVVYQKESLLNNLVRLPK